MRTPNLIDVRAELARRSLVEFVRQAWPVVVPGSPFVPGFHVDAIGEQLEAVLCGEIRRLLINIPPRHAKSLLTSVFWPAWAWLTRADLCWLFASYAQSLATRDSVRTRRLIESPWYRARWDQRFALTEDQNVKIRFDNDRGGVRLATSVGGSATGEGGDIIVIDDPHKIEEAHSSAAREAVLEWFDGTISTRLNDPRSGAIVVIGQRLHERDLFGHLLSQGGFEHLCLPAEYEPTHPFLWPDDPRHSPGQLLWPKRFGKEELARLKRSLGSYGTAGQLQQLPAPAMGGIFRREWWSWYDPAGPLPQFETIVQSWDLSFSGGPTADYVVGQAWGKVGADIYLLRQFRERIGFTETITAIREFTATLDSQFPGRRGHAILIERAANGAAAIDVLKHEIPSLIAVTPDGDKVNRAHAVSPQIEAGNVYLPGEPASDRRRLDNAITPAWVPAFVEETAAFPKATNDDQVDAMTQALIRLNRPGPRLRVIG